MLVYITIDHAVIRAWASRRQASPVTFEGHERPWPLLFSFGALAAGLLTLSWEEFFDEFESAGLAFVYRDTSPDGEVDNFHEFVERAAVPELVAADRPTIIEKAT